MSFQNVTDLIDINLCLVVFCLHGSDLVGLLFEKSQESLLFLGIKGFQLCYHTGEQISHLAKILGSHVFQRCLGKISHLLLGSHAIL